jgi:hypothetical protein
MEINLLAPVSVGDGQEACIQSGDCTHRSFLMRYRLKTSGGSF